LHLGQDCFFQFVALFVGGVLPVVANGQKLPDILVELEFIPVLDRHATYAMQREFKSVAVVLPGAVSISPFRR
jgi:hypothetical protein